MLVAKADGHAIPQLDRTDGYESAMSSSSENSRRTSTSSGA
jgi:hypothetical protein